MIRSLIFQTNRVLRNIVAKYFHSVPEVYLIDETIKYINDHKCSVSRFGDGELMIILGYGIRFQDADGILQSRLLKILRNDQPNLMVTVPDIFTEARLNLRTDENKKFWKLHLSKHRKDWYQYMDRKKVYFNTAISRFYYPIKDKTKSKEYAALLKKIWNDQDLLIVEGEYSRLGIGNDLFNESRSLQRIICPAKNAFSAYDQILAEAKKYGKGKLILIALGPTATVLAADLAGEGFWAIDIGHVDMEYMWMLQGSNGLTPVRGRVLNEVAAQQDSALSQGEENNYITSIVKRVG